MRRTADHSQSDTSMRLKAFGDVSTVPKGLRGDEWRPSAPVLFVHGVMHVAMISPLTSLSGVKTSNHVFMHAYAAHTVS